MNTENKIRELLKKVYDDGRVNAMEVAKCYKCNTGCAGWHYTDFGSNEAMYLGRSLREILELDDFFNEVTK